MRTSCFSSRRSLVTMEQQRSEMTSYRLLESKWNGLLQRTIVIAGCNRRLHPEFNQMKIRSMKREMYDDGEEKR